MGQVIWCCWTKCSLVLVDLVVLNVIVSLRFLMSLLVYQHRCDDLLLTYFLILMNLFLLGLLLPIHLLLHQKVIILLVVSHQIQLLILLNLRHCWLHLVVVLQLSLVSLLVVDICLLLYRILLLIVEFLVCMIQSFLC